MALVEMHRLQMSSSDALHLDGAGVDSTAGLLAPPLPTSAVQSDAAKELARTLPVGFTTIREETSMRVTALTATAAVNTEENYHLLTVDELVRRYKTNPTRGLTTDEAAARLSAQGPNSIKAAPTNWLRKISTYLFGGFCWLLWIAAVVTFLAWQPLGQPPALATLALAIVLLIVIFLQAIFTAYQDWTSSRVMSSINSMLPQTAMTVRSGETVKVPISTLVTGDVVVLKYGNKVPADARLIDVHGLRVDNSILTGESAPVRCTVDATHEIVTDTRNIVLMGTHITEGEAVGVVVETGDRTMMGKVAGLAGRTKAKPTILQQEITRFTYIIAALSLTTGTICMIVWATWLRVQYPTYINLSNMLSTDMGIIVAYVPEGLPIAVTLVLSIIARRMYKQKVLVKNLTTVETLGCVDVLCSDKTGTLTTNQMVVGTVAVGGRVSNVGSGRMPDAEVHTTGFRLLATYAHLCNGAAFDPADHHLPIAAQRVNGDATDTAMLRYAATFTDISTDKLSYRRVHHIPFNSSTKYMVTVVQPLQGAAAAPASDGAANLAAAALSVPALVLLMKGAPDLILSKCTHFLDADDTATIKPLTDADRATVMGLQEAWGAQGQRVLLVARRILSEHEFPEAGLGDDSQIGAFLHDLCVVGIVGIVDPPRPETAEVVRTIRGAGVRVFMVTGDFPSTAAAIARQVGIFSFPTTHRLDDLQAKSDVAAVGGHDDQKVPAVTLTSTSGDLHTATRGSVHGGIPASLLLTGADVNVLTDRHWDAVAAYDEIVFARTTPEQKYRIVKAFQARKSIVAVTGDGVNDAPALKTADIGVAMGAGSEVAMEAASMVLLDSNFSSIVEALRQGRTVFDNLKKVCLYLLPAGTFSELIPVLMNIFLGVPLPLSAFLMIMICILTDMAPAMALMYEKGESDLLTRRPRRPGKDALVNAKLMCHAYFFIGIIETFYAHLMYFVYMQTEWGVAPNQLFLAFSNWGVDGYAGLTADEQVTANATGQCVYFVTLVILQFGNLLATRTRHLSILQQSPLKNKYLFLAMPCSIIIAIFLLYGPAFQTVFLTAPIPAQYWFTPMPVALLLILLDEARKYVVRTRPNSSLARMAW